MRPVYDESVEGFTMWRWTLVLVALFGLGLGTITAQSAGQAGAQSSGEMSMSKPVVPAGPLKITFADKSSEWTPATLAGLPHKTVTVYNEHAKTNQTFSGVELIDLLKPLGVAEKPHGKEFRLYLIAEGSDGYQVVYSIGEVTPDVHDGTVLVADTLDGKPIGATGPLQLVTTGEKRPARWVRNLVAIHVRTAE
jgi:hypothetical protein